MKLTFINDKYGDKALAFYKNYNVKLPIIGHQYTIRKVILNPRGEYCLLLNEIKNECVWVSKKPVGEPGFHYSKFTDVPNNVLSWEVVHEIFKNQK